MKIKIDEKFVRKTISEVCKKRRESNCIMPHPPCYFNKQLCKIKSCSKDLKLGEIVRCICRCYIGDVHQDDWIFGQFKEKLIGVIDASINIDWLLHLSKKRYRDHSSHQLFVAVLGVFLLGCKFYSNELNEKVTLRKWISNQLKIEENLIDHAWWVVSLLHDHAYPLAHMLKTVPSIAEENRKELLDQTWNLLGFKEQSYKVFNGLYDFGLLNELRIAVNINQDNQRTEIKKNILMTIKKRLTSFYFEENEFCSDNELCYDHGIIAAANIASFVQFPDKYPILKHIVRAIAIHNGAACPNKVCIDKDPLAFLLIVCDECQEWERKIIVGDEVVSESNSIGFDNLKKVNNSFETDTFSVIFEYSDANRLKRTGWSYPLFQRAKDEAFSRLYVCTNSPIKKLHYKVLIPHEKNLLTPNTRA